MRTRANHPRTRSVTPLLAAVGAIIVGFPGCSRPWVNTVGISRLFVAEVPRDGGPDELRGSRAAEVCLTTAREMEEAGHLSEAIDLYLRARSHEENMPGVAHRLAVLYGQTGQPLPARQEFGRAVAESPGDANLLTDFGVFLMAQREFDPAERALREAVELVPDHPRATTNLALLCARTARLDEAYELFTRAVGPAAAHSNLGVVLAQAGDHDLARSHLQQALELDPALEIPRAFDDYLAQSK